MAFVAINASEVDVGDPVTAELGVKIKDNFDDHESRISSVEALAQKVIVFDFPVLNATKASTLTGLTYWRAPVDFVLTEAKIACFEVGSLTGTLEVDFKKNTSLDSVGMTSVFTTKPSIDYGTASNYDESTNAVFDVANQSVSIGDYIRFDVTGLPTNGIAGKFYISLIGEI